MLGKFTSAVSTILGTIMVFAVASVQAATVPPEFKDSNFQSGFPQPTAMEFAPDGRLFVLQQTGQVRVIKKGVLLSSSFVNLTVDSRGERGLLGIAFDPNFAINQFVYFYHTVPGSPAHNRITRYTAKGDVAVSSSAKIILNLPNLSSATNHNGGAIHFGADGKLYVAVGENANKTNSPSLTTLLGKILRINSDGTIPADNPTSFQGISGTTSGVNRAIWAVGYRNPFTFATERTTGKIFINDVGGTVWEEIDRLTKGANYGWPTSEGSTTNSNHTKPIYAYGHSGTTPAGCAITGGSFYRPLVTQFPSSYLGKYFFADYCGGWIYYVDGVNPGGATKFATGISQPVDLKVGPDGALYYLARGTNSVGRIQHTGTTTQEIITSVGNLLVTEGYSGTYTVRLAQKPTSSVTVKIARTSGTSSITVTPSLLVFTTSNWSTPRTVTVKAIEDSDLYDNGATITLTASGMVAKRVIATAVENGLPAGTPRAQIVFPQDGDVVSGSTAEFFGNALGTGCTKAEFSIDGVKKFTDSNRSGHYHIGGNHNMWNTKLVPNGPHTLLMTVYRSNGQRGSHQITVTVQN